MDFHKLSKAELEDFGGSRDAEAAARNYEFVQNDPESEERDYTKAVRDLELAARYTGPRDNYYTEQDIDEFDDATIDIFAQVFGLDTTGLSPIQVRYRVFRILRFLDLIVPPVDLGTEAEFIPFTKFLINEFSHELGDSVDEIYSTVVSSTGKITQLTPSMKTFLASAPIIQANGPILIRSFISSNGETVIRGTYAVPSEDGAVTFGQFVEALVNNQEGLARSIDFSKMRTHNGHKLDLHDFDIGNLRHVGGPYFEVEYVA